MSFSFSASGAPAEIVDKVREAAQNVTAYGREAEDAFTKDNVHAVDTVVRHLETLLPELFADVKHIIVSAHGHGRRDNTPSSSPPTLTLNIQSADTAPTPPATETPATAETPATSTETPATT